MEFVNFNFSIPYILVFFLFLLSSIPIYDKDYKLDQRCLKQYNYFQVLLIFVIYTFFLSFRGFLYTDFVGYVDFFKECPVIWDFEQIDFFFNNSVYSAWEDGFVIFTILIKSIFNNYFFFQFVCSTIDFFVLYCFFKYYTPKNIILCFSFFLIFSGLVLEINLMRNVKSIIIFLISIRFLVDKKYFKYILCNVLGMLFHVSSFLYILLLPVIIIKHNKKSILILYFIGFIIFVFGISWCTELIITLGEILPGRIGLLLRTYVDDSPRGFPISIGFIERTFTFWLSYFLAFSKKYSMYSDRKNIIIFNCMFIYLFVSLYFREISMFQERVVILFVLSYWIVYPLFYSRLNKNQKIIFMIIFLLYGFLKLFSEHRYLIHKWDSAFFLNYSYDERKQIVDIYFRKYL